MARYRFVVLSNPVDGREDDYNAWYDTYHLRDILAIPGVETAQRLRVLGDPSDMSSEIPCPYGYLALYEIETDDIEAVAAALADPTGRVRSNAVDMTRTVGWLFEELGEKRQSTTPA